MMTEQRVIYDMKHTKRMRKKGDSQRSKPYIFIPPLVVGWLQQNFIAHPDGIVNKEEMYKRYEDFCKDNDIAPKRNNIFGKILRTVFPTIHSRRLGPTGGGVPHYGGIVSCTPMGDEMPVPNSSLPSLDVLSKAASSLKAEENERRSWEKLNKEAAALIELRNLPAYRTTPSPAPLPRHMPLRDDYRSPEKEQRVFHHRPMPLRSEVVETIDQGVGFFKINRSASSSSSSSPSPTSPQYGHGIESEAEDIDGRKGYESPVTFERPFDTYNRESTYIPRDPTYNRELAYNPTYGRESPFRSHYTSYHPSPLSHMYTQPLSSMPFLSAMPPVPSMSPLLPPSQATRYAKAYRDKFWSLSPMPGSAFDCNNIDYYLNAPGKNEKPVLALCANVALYLGALCCEDAVSQAKSFFMTAQDISTRLHQTVDANLALALVYMAHGTWRFYPAKEALDMAQSYITSAMSICESLNATDSDTFQKCVQFNSLIWKDKMSVAAVQERIGKCYEMMGKYNYSAHVENHLKVRDVQTLINTAECVLHFFKTAGPEYVDRLHKDLDALRYCLDIAYSICDDESIGLARIWIISVSADLQALLGEHDKALRTATFFLQIVEDCARNYGSGHISSVVNYFEPILTIFLQSNSEHLIRHTLGLFDKQNLCVFNNVYTLVEKWRSTLQRMCKPRSTPSTASGAPPPMMMTSPHTEQLHHWHPSPSSTATASSMTTTTSTATASYPSM